MSKPILLVLGAGNNVGASTASFFAKQGYRVALVSRSISPKDYPEHLTIKADLADVEAIKGAFEQVRRELGDPNVVLHNAAAFPPSQTIFDIPVAEYEKSLRINTISVYVAAQLAVEGFSRISNGPKTFLFTGNALNKIVLPSYWAMGTGKIATAHLISAAAQTYADKGYSFYYVDERTAEGAPVGNNIQGPAHAEIYWELSQLKKQEDAIVTFVAGKGRVNFDK
ncbi:putative short-chain dehydrogenase [Xylogone sp. PMI_703]|nr:putative short-chain dehydrogenase [Xylogone sp. PMI_703]